ncbi:MAG: TolC family protein [Ignavibacteriales bacterium]|nr:TolC family protein [Ignavibacteriales bacterium]
MNKEYYQINRSLFTFVFLLLSFLFSHNFAQTKVYTLDASIQLGIINSKTLKISNSKLAISSAKVTEISSQRMPKLSFNATYMRLSEVPPFEISLPILPAPITVQEAVLNNYNFKLSLQQPIFTGFKLSSLHSAAEYNFESTELEYSNDINEEAFKIISAFYNIYKAENTNKIIEENLKSLEAHIKDSKNFLANDLIIKNDLLKIEVQYSSVQLKKVEAENGLEIAKALFNKTIGNEISDEVNIKTDKISLSIDSYDFNTLLNEAKNNRLELESISKKVLAGKEQVSASNSGWYPSVFLFSDFYYSRPNQRYFPIKDQFDDSWDVGVTLSWDIWNWGYNSSQTQQAENNLVQLETAKSQLEDGIEIEVYNSYLNLQSAIKKVNLTKLTLEQAEENYRITNDKYLVQLASSTDLLDAESSLYSAKVDVLNSLVDYELAKIKLDKSVGKKLY